MSPSISSHLVTSERSVSLSDKLTASVVRPPEWMISAFGTKKNSSGKSIQSLPLCVAASNRHPPKTRIPGSPLSRSSIRSARLPKAAEPMARVWSPPDRERQKKRGKSGERSSQRGEKKPSSSSAHSKRRMPEASGRAERCGAWRSLCRPMRRADCDGAAGVIAKLLRSPGRQSCVDSFPIAA